MFGEGFFIGSLRKEIVDRAHPPGTWHNLQSQNSSTYSLDLSVPFPLVISDILALDFWTFGLLLFDFWPFRLLTMSFQHSSISRDFSTFWLLTSLLESFQHYVLYKYCYDGWILWGRLIAACAGCFFCLSFGAINNVAFWWNMHGLASSKVGCWQPPPFIDKQW